MESIGSRAIPHSPSNTSDLTSFRQLQRFPENTVPSLEEHWLQHSNSRRAPKSSRDESWFPGFDSRGMPTFHKHLKRRLLSAIGIWEGPWVCCLKWNGHRVPLTRGKAWFPCSDSNSSLCFLSQHEGMSECPVETLERALVPRLISTGGFTSRWHLQRNGELHASTGDDAWLLLKIDRNSNIPVATGKGPWVSLLNSRGVPTALPQLEENPKVSLETRQESWRRWENKSV